MARKSTAAPKHMEPEDESQEAPDAEAADNEAEEAGGGMSKSDAVRAALAEGLEKPEKATDFIRQRFGIEMSKQHFSAVKSQLKRKERESGEARPVAEPRAAHAPRTPPPEKHVAMDLLADLEAIKRLIAEHGADKVKRMVDLLGE